MEDRRPRAAGFFLGIFVAVGITVALAALLMRPPWADLKQLALISSLTALISAGIGYIAHRLGLWRRLGSLGLSLTLGYVLAAGLMLLNVWVTARLMFLSEHDLALAGVLLLFAAGISISIGYLLSSGITSAIQQILVGTRQLSGKDYSVRVPESGRDEVAQLARAFNEMASRLGQADDKAKRLESARRDFIAWVSHDLRTPLSALQAMLDAIVEDVVIDKESVDRYLHQCQTEIRRMSDLIDDLFQLAQLDIGHLSLEYEVSSLSDLISDALGGVRALAEAKQVRVAGWVDKEVDPVWMAPREISRVLHNLLENSLRHTPAGGDIQLQAEIQDGHILVSVSDTGEGISPEDLPHVFDRFFRGEKSRARNKDAEGGSGLGLSIVKGLIEAHGGRIWIESEPGSNTVVKFTLPRSHRSSDGRE